MVSPDKDSVPASPPASVLAVSEGVEQLATNTVESVRAQVIETLLNQVE